MEVDMKQTGSSKWLRILCLLLGCTSAIFLCVGFLENNRPVESNVVPSSSFAQVVGKEIHPLRSLLTFQENLVARFIYYRVDKGVGLEGVRGEIEPIFMIYDGKFIDPSEETKRVGFEIFNHKWFDGKTYLVYFSGKEIGNLSIFSMKADGRGRCKDELWGEATYKGSDVFGGNFTIKIGEEKIYPSSTSLFGLARKDDSLFYKEKRIEGQISEEMVKKIKQFGNLEFEKMVQRLKKPTKDVEADQEWRQGVTLQAIDLDGNGKKDLIGVFDLLVKFKYTGQQKIAIRSPPQYRYRLMYVLYDNGTGEVIWPFFENGTWLDGLLAIKGFFNIGETMPAILISSSYPTNFIQYQNEPFQYELLANYNGKGWVTIFKGRPNNCK
jgi:hypothetical protein